MNYSRAQLWERFQKYYTEFPSLGLALDLSRMNFTDDFFATMEPRMQKAFVAMSELEKGAIANPDENRMVGHYWLRNPALAPTVVIRKEIEKALVAVKTFAKQVHEGTVRGAGGPFKNLLLIGIGGSALGPQFVAHALGYPGRDKMRSYFLDNTDPDGIDRVIESIGLTLGQTLCVVISKSGGTRETQNGMIEVQAAYQREGMNFGRHAVAVTSTGSTLDSYAVQRRWLRRFPMWDWVGGRTSELSAVGLLPAALQGIDVDSLLAGAKACDEITRVPVVKANPAAQLALMWYCSGNGKGEKSMIILPYKDRLELFSKYLQQLIMESLGKEFDNDGKVVNQGITVLGNKGSTDQHSYMQQLRDGLSNFFVIFIEVLRHRHSNSQPVERNATSGDYLTCFMLGSRSALYEKGRESLVVTVDGITPFSVGVLIALFERAVGLYASVININPYNQPGVEAGKKAASELINLEIRVLEFLDRLGGNGATATEIANGLGAQCEVENIFRLCQSLSENPDRGVVKADGNTALEALFKKH